MTAEIIEYSIQTAAMFVCAIIALVHAGRYKSRSWTLLALFYGCWVMDDTFWLLCRAFTGSSPEIGALADLNWYASIVFLYLLISRISPSENSREKRVLPWLGVAFTLGMAVFFIVQWGNIVSNLIYAGLMGLLLFASIRRLLDGDNRKHRFILIMILVFVLLVYAMWTVSCYFYEDTYANPYYWFDLLITVSLVLLIPAVKKAVAE